MERREAPRSQAGLDRREDVRLVRLHELEPLRLEDRDLLRRDLVQVPRVGALSPGTVRRKCVGDEHNLRASENFEAPEPAADPRTPA